jgi:hypothetical protein
MTAIIDVEGNTQYIDDDTVVTLAGPAPADPPNRSYVTGPGVSPIQTNEDVAVLLARLRPKTPLAKLTRPNNTPVWVKGAAVSRLMAPTANDIIPGELVGTVLYFGGLRQAVVEDVPAVRAIVNAHNGNV